MDPAASVRSLASAGKIGELFQYTVGNVSIQRQRSAMIPIVTQDVEVEKLSIYNEAVLALHPLNGARIKNTTKTHLLQGPLTIIEAGGYAGDARIDNVPPGQERLVSYGVDLQTLVHVESLPESVLGQSGRVVTGKIVNGVLEVKLKGVDGQRYVIQNKGDVPRTVIVEHPKNDWQLIEPAEAEEVTDDLYRFSRKINPGQTLGLNVRVETVAAETVSIVQEELPTLIAYTKEGSIPKPVRDALAKAADLRNAIAGFERQVAAGNKRIEDVGKEQARLRENMKTVSQESEYYQRLLKKLDEQETSVEKIQAEVLSLEEERDKARAELEAYLKDLNVG